MSAFCRSSSRLPRPLFAAMHRRYTLDVAAPLLRTQSYLDGQWVSAASEFPVLDPCTGQEIARVSNCGADEARVAVAAAYDAFQSWKRSTAKVAAVDVTHTRRSWNQDPVLEPGPGSADFRFCPAGEERPTEEVVRPDAAAPGPAGAVDHLRVREYLSMLIS